MDLLNEHEKRILRFIERYENKFGRTPSYEEIRKGTGMRSKDHVYRDVSALEQRRYLRRERAISRGITLLRTADGYPVTPFSYSIPVVGDVVPATRAPGADPAARDWIEITRAMIPDAEDVFAIRVKGNSMVDALVNDGDTIVMKRQQAASDGELIAVRVKRDSKNPSLSLRRYFHRGNHILLRPEDPALDAEQYSETDIEIQGTVLCIIRNIPRPMAVQSHSR